MSTDGTDGNDNDTTADIRLKSDGNIRAALTEGSEPAPEGEGPWLVNGVLLADGEVTHGLHGSKYWPGEEQKKAALTGVGKEFSVLHEDKAVGKGRVTDMAYQPGLGTVYEAEVDDWELAAALGNGTFDVSLEASVPNHDHIEYEEIGGEEVPYMTDYSYNRIAAVAGDGASDANYSTLGSAADNPAIAALAHGGTERTHSALASALAAGDSPAPDSTGGNQEMVEATIEVPINGYPIDSKTLVSIAEDNDIGWNALLDAASELSPEDITIKAEEEPEPIRIY